MFVACISINAFGADKVKRTPASKTCGTVQTISRNGSDGLQITFSKWNAKTTGDLNSLIYRRSDDLEGITVAMLIAAWSSQKTVCLEFDEQKIISSISLEGERIRTGE